MIGEARCVLEARNGVGESLVWSVAGQRLHWVDITGKRLEAFHPATGEHHVQPLPEFATSVGLRAEGGFVVGLRRRVCLLDAGGRLETLAEIEPDRPRNRLNEGRVAPDGSFWVGTMQDNLDDEGRAVEIEAWTGALWRVSPEGDVARLTPHEFGIANTMIWGDGRFVCADTLADRLYAYDHVPGPEALGHRRVLSEGVGRGLPDGSCVDREGFIWNARFGGGCVARLAPDGALDRLVELPCANPTSCAVGGPDLSTIYVTSARFGLPPERLDDPLEGGLFAVETSTSGRPEPLFGRGGARA